MKFGINFSRAFRSMVIRANYLLGNYEEVVWIIGDGRSGTTWVSDVVNWDKRYREMFEPFHPRFVPDAGFMMPHHYIRRNDEDEEMLNFAGRVFSGRFLNNRVDSENNSLLYKGLLIKDIFANLMCYWAVSRFPYVRPVLLMRNPFSVAVSKYKKREWYWMTDPLDFLLQLDLKRDYLLPFEDEIRRVSRENNFILNQVLIWSIINYVPLRQFSPGELHVCFYEDIYASPLSEVSRLVNYVGGRERGVIDIPEEIVKRPSRVIGEESNLLAGTSPITSWRNELDSNLIDSGLRILDAFGLADLYDDVSMPNRRVVDRVQGGVH